MARLQARADDLADVYALLEEASAWLHTRGIDQWNTPYSRDRLDREVLAGHVWCWKAEARVIATATLLPRTPDYYPKGIWDDMLPAWYVCRLAVSRSLKGAAVGEHILLQLAEDALRDGIKALRLDVTAANSFLETYYGARGFRRVAEGYILGHRCLFLEKPLKLTP